MEAWERQNPESTAGANQSNNDKHKSQVKLGKLFVLMVNRIIDDP